MATIKAPFNFVPLSDKVFFPKWANQISQDIPFSDGLSGTIELKITAESPIFVRNGHSKEDAQAKNDTYKSFSKTPDGKYFIPGTSIKGAIRNILEIMSFGKISLDKKAKFAQREWDNPALYPLKKEQTKFHCGYLKQTENGYEITDCGRPYRIGHDEIDKYLERKGIGENMFRSKFCKGSDFDIKKDVCIEGKSFDPKTAAFKYFLVGKVQLNDLSFSESDASTEYSTRLSVSEGGDITGDIVLTGQPDKWAWPRPTELSKDAGKFYEFVFPVVPNSQRHMISEETFNHFKFIYSQSSEWDRAKRQLDKKGIPVFFRMDGDKIKDFGLAYLYKLPYQNSPYDTLPSEHKTEKPDLAECIFGYTKGKNALRGRVQFSNAFSDDAVHDDLVMLSLGSPKGSYYPIYIEQKDGNKGKVTKYTTYNDGQISGWKRYHVRSGTWKKATGNDQIDTVLFPVKKGSTFLGKIRFHNLKSVELGALLSAVTFHSTEGCFHQIGQGKPFGFGKVSVSIESISCVADNNSNIDPQKLMALFEKEMEDNQIYNWCNTRQITQLFTLSRELVQAEDVLYQYMEMSNTPQENQFLIAKKQNEYLQRYSELLNRKYHPKSLYADIKMEIERAEQERQMQEEEAQREKRERFSILKSEADELFRQKQYEAAKEKYIIANDLQVENIYYLIEQCETAIQSRINIKEGHIEDFVKTSSIPACANNLKKWLEVHGELTEEQCRRIAELMKNQIFELNKSKQRDWKEWKKWKPIIDVLDESRTKHIYDQIFS